MKSKYTEAPDWARTHPVWPAVKVWESQSMQGTHHYCQRSDGSIHHAYRRIPNPLTLDEWNEYHRLMEIVRRHENEQSIHALPDKAIVEWEQAHYYRTLSDSDAVRHAQPSNKKLQRWQKRWGQLRKHGALDVLNKEFSRRQLSFDAINPQQG